MGSQVAASKGMTTALSEAMKKGGKPADKTPPKITFTPSSGAKVISGAEDAGEKFEAILNDQAAMKKAAETKSEMPSAGNKNIFEGAYEKNQQYKAAQKEMQSKKAEEEYEKALKKTAMEKLQAAAAEKKAKYSSYSPFSKSDMPTATKFQNPYPEYLFKGKAPSYGDYMAVTSANNPLMSAGTGDPYGDQLKQYQLQKLQQQNATEQDKIKNLFAMIAQGNQGQQPPAQG